MIRLLLALAAVGSAAWAQFGGLGTTYDGSTVYFASALKLKGSNQLPYGKLFSADESGVRLVRSLPGLKALTTYACAVGDFYAFFDAEVSADGQVITSTIQRTESGYCLGHANVFGTELISPTSDIQFRGILRMSPDGRHAIVFDASQAVFGYEIISDIFYLDPQTGTRTAVPFEHTASPILPPSQKGRAIADDGTAIVAFYPPFIVRPGSALEPFPVPGARPVAIDAAGANVLYYTESNLRLFNLKTKEDRLVADAGAEINLAYVQMSDDAQRVLYTCGEQLCIADTNGSGSRVLTSEPLGISDATLSGDGKVVFAATGGARLIKINVDNGTQIEIIGRTPFLSAQQVSGIAGLAATADGGGLSDTSLTATPPLNPWLGNLTMWIEERKVPVVSVTPNSVRFLVPWDLAKTPARIRAEVPGVHSPFDFPETTIASLLGPVPGAIKHQNWDGVLSVFSPPHTGEIIHLFMAGLGAVSPEVPVGAAAPLAPLSRIDSRLVCPGSEVLFAGLAPGYVERFYQVDLRLGSVAGYTQFKCSLDGGDPFVFLSPNVPIISAAPE